MSDRPGTSKADWQPIETAPENMLLLLFSPQRSQFFGAKMEVGFAGCGRVDEYGAHIRGTWSYHAWATHWAYLPAIPDPN